ncbi:MAG TPA: WD40 repeat domain-containing protein [Anaerolineales bacterium]|nr:WD40 repeat domain-containing protein [Anaerolineales bacterium]
MKTLVPVLAALTMLFACSLPGGFSAVESPASTATIMADTSTQTPASPDIPVPPTAIPPSPTPVSPELGVDTVARLSIFSTFGQGEALRSLAFSPDGTALASAGGNSEDFAIRLWDVGSGLHLQTLQGHTSIVWGVAFSPDGQMLASASSDGTGKIWDWRAGAVIESLDFPNEVVSVAFSPDGQTLAVGGVDGFPNASVWTFAVPSWQPGLKLAEFWNIPSLAFMPDGQYLVGGGTSRNARIWRTSDGLSLFTLSHSGQVSSLAISPDGSTIASGLCEASGASGTCARGGVWFWDVHTGKLMRKVSDFTDWVERVAYSLDGSVLIAGSRDETLRFYATSDFQPILVTSSPGGGGVLAVSPDGRLLATSGRNGLIHLWRVGP